jgi:CheY-like chemotaxis protein
MSHRIIIVDDESSFAEIGEIILTRAGYDVRKYEHAGDALQELSSFRPDLILSDVEMPGMDGFEFLREIRSRPEGKDTPFILMSARRTYPPDRIKGLELGTDDYITKPFSGDELVLRVKAVLRRAGRAETPPPAGVETTPALDTYLQQQGIAPAQTAPAPPVSPASPAGNPALDLEPLPVLTELRRRLAAGEPTAVLLADVSFFRGYNECYGYDRGDQVLAFVAQCLRNANHAASNGADPASRLYADEFLLVSTPERAPQVALAALQEFTRGILSFFSQEDLHRGFIEGKNRRGLTVAYPFLNLTIGVASNSLRKLTHPGQFIQVGRELLAYAKTLGGSRFVVDRRKDAKT